MELTLPRGFRTNVRIGEFSIDVDRVDSAETIDQWCGDGILNCSALCVGERVDELLEPFLLERESFMQHKSFDRIVMDEDDEDDLDIDDGSDLEDDADDLDEDDDELEDEWEEVGEDDEEDLDDEDEDDDWEEDDEDDEDDLAGV